MRRPMLAGSAFALAVFALGSTPAAACGWGGWGGCGCGAYGYGASATMGHQPTPTTRLRPTTRVPPTRMHLRRTMRRLRPTTHLRSTMRVLRWLPTCLRELLAAGLLRAPYVRCPLLATLNGGRGGYIAAANPNLPKGPVPAAIPGARGNYPFAAKDGPRVNKPPMPNYRAPGISASAADVGWREEQCPTRPLLHAGDRIMSPLHITARPETTPGGGGSGSQPQVLALARRRL